MTRYIALLIPFFALGCAMGPKRPPEPPPKGLGPTSIECKQLGPPSSSNGIAGPAFPQTARSANQEGWVALRFDVENGNPVRTRLVGLNRPGFGGGCLV